MILASKAPATIAPPGGMPAGSHSRYRADIDGLRTVAVLPVILFHAGVAHLGGGFVGVDVFFVISGFLITGILHREIVAGHFSIVRFYERRVRRILPNLIAMLTATTVAGLLLLIPADLMGLGKSIIATLAFAANIYFWKTIGYFTPNAGQLPLLHTWSLGVEEQYYLIFPLILLAFTRGRAKQLRPVVGILLVLSFALSVVQVTRAPNAAFYLPFSRLWELMVGSLLAIGAVPPIRSAAVRQIVAAAGLIAILAAILLLSDKTPFPGAAALLPCLGAAAILHAGAGGETAVSRVLSLRAPVMIGQWSYSLYIWHWPVIVFGRYALQRDFTAVETIFVLAVVLALAVAAWAWIEKPMRGRGMPTRRLLAVTGTGAAALAVGSASLWFSHGLPQRYSPEVRQLAAGATDINPWRTACDRPSLKRIESGTVCVIGAPGAPPTFALVGDSFGDAMLPGVERAAREAGAAGYVLTQSGCAPLLGIDEPSDLCRDKVSAEYALIRRTPSIRNVLLIGRWPTMVDGHRFGLFRQEGIRLVERAGAPPLPNAPVVERAFVRSAQALAPVTLWIVHGIAEQVVVVPQAATLRSLYGGDLEGLPAAAHAAREASTRAILARVRAQANVRLIDAGRVMCGRDVCPIIADGRALYADDNHPSRFAAERMRGMLAPALR